MILKVKQVKYGLVAGVEIAFIHQDVAKQLSVHAGERVEIKCLHCGKKTVAVVDVGMGGLVKKDEIAISEEVAKEIGRHKNQKVEIQPSFKPISATYVTKKLKNHTLSYTEIYSIISDIIQNKLTDVEIAYFCAAVGLNDMNLNEVTALTKAMVNVGQQIKWKHRYVLDKHSCSGIAGNRTTPLVISIIGAAINHLKLDAVIPKTSSRAITSAAGTADDIELLTNVEFSTKELKNIVEKTKACFVWNGILGLAPADDKIIQIERNIQLESHEQIAASILAKKIAMGATHVVMDIPYGKSAKFSKKSAKSIANLIKKVSKKFRLKVKCMITNGNQPIGNGIGPVLEMRDVVSVLRRTENRPLDLEKKALLLATELLRFLYPRGEAERICMGMLDSGKAYEKFKEILKAQGGSDKEADISRKLTLGKFFYVLRADKKGIIRDIDNKKIAYLSKLLGCPADKSAGLYLHRHLGHEVREGDELLTLYAECEEKLEYTKSMLKHVFPIEIE
jgi:thymidine phosphorylase